MKIQKLNGISGIMRIIRIDREDNAEKMLVDTGSIQALTYSNLMHLFNIRK